MKITVLDGYTTNPGDLSFEGLGRYGELAVYDRTQPDEVVARARDSEIIVSNKVAFDDAVFDELPKLRLITVLGTGYNTVDVACAARRGITVCNVPGYSTPSVTQHVFALLLELCSHVAEYSESVRRGGWQNSRDYSYCVRPIVEIGGMTLGIVGLGAIGTAVARAARGFGMEVVYFSRTRKPALECDGIRYLPLEALLPASDAVTLHCPLTPETYHLLNAGTIARMKDGALVINTSRGAAVDERALADALNSGKLGGAGIDVLPTEPPRGGSPLIGAKNCIVTPPCRVGPARFTRAAYRRDRKQHPLLSRGQAAKQGQLTGIGRD